jgi:hypothetical protein
VLQEFIGKRLTTNSSGAVPASGHSLSTSQYHLP